MEELQEKTLQRESVSIEIENNQLPFSELDEEIKARIVDLRKNYELRITNYELQEVKKIDGDLRIYITDIVQIDISATEIRQKVKDNAADWRGDVPVEVAKYIEKYELYI